jgi:DNA-binding MarR family transcriptional regulator
MAEPKWLTAEEQATWRALMVMIQRVHEQLERQLQRDAKMTHASYQVLVVLSAAKDAPGMSELAQKLGWSQSRLSHAMSWLEKSGWVQRIPSPTDRRSNLAQITEKGRQKLAEAAPGHVAAARHLVIDALTAEQQQSLQQISEAITSRPDTPML